MEKDRLVQLIKERTADLLDGPPFNLERSRDSKRTGKAEWVCPLCGHGQGGDGMGFNPRSGGHGLICHACGFSGDLIALYQDIHPGEKFLDVLDALGEPLGEKADRRPATPTRATEATEGPSTPTRPAEATEGPSTPTRPAEATEGPSTPTRRPTASWQSIRCNPYYSRCAEALAKSEAAKAYLKKRGLDPELLADYSVGFDPESDPAAAPFGKGEPKHPTGRVIIPVANDFYIARRIDGNPDHKAVYPKGGQADIWNAQALDSTKPLVICEGALDALSVKAASPEVEAVGLNSASYARLLSERLETANNARFIVNPDQDAAGRRACEELLSTLKALGRPASVARLPHGYKDANDLWTADPERFRSWLEKAVGGPRLAKNAGLRILEGDWAAAAERLRVRTSTGFANLDQALGGGLPNGLCILAGASGFGKTTLALNVADNVAESGRPVLYFCLEEGQDRLTAKLLARRCTAEGYPRTAGDLLKAAGDLGEAEGIVNGWASRPGGRFAFYEGLFSVTADEVVTKTREFIDSTGERPLVVVDYLQALQCEDLRIDYRKQVDLGVHALAVLANEERLPVLALSNVNRSSYYGELSFVSLKESGGLEFAADSVVTLQPTAFIGSDLPPAAARALDEEERKRSPRDVTLKVLKLRGGRPLMTARFDYDAAHETFTETGN